LDVTVGTNARSSTERDGWSVACVGHSNSDFDSIGFPSYQHLRPSIRRQDQYPCWFEGAEMLHCCFAKAVVVSIGGKVMTVNVDRTIEKNRFVTTHLKY
jgi:hypothetical protein